MENRDTKIAVAGVGLISLATLIASLAKKTPAGQYVMDDDVRQALAALLVQQNEINGKLDILSTISETLTAINSNILSLAEKLGVMPERIIEPFKKENQTLASKERFNIYERSLSQGALIWCLVDVSDPNTTVSFKFDKVVWEFNYSTLLSQGIERPLFPGVWLTKADPVNSRYVLLFSAGNLEGFKYNDTLIIYVTFNGTGSATLNEARGINWINV